MPLFLYIPQGGIQKKLLTACTIRVCVNMTISRTHCDKNSRIFFLKMYNSIWPYCISRHRSVTAVNFSQVLFFLISSFWRLDFEDFSSFRRLPFPVLLSWQPPARRPLLFFSLLPTFAVGIALVGRGRQLDLPPSRPATGKSMEVPYC